MKNAKRLIGTLGIGGLLFSTQQANAYNWTTLDNNLNAYCCGSSVLGTQTESIAFVLGNASGNLNTFAAGTTQQGLPDNINTSHLIASTTKLAAAVAIMTLVDSGQLDLNARVTTYIQNYMNMFPSDTIAPQILSALTGDSNKATITMKQLLSHTSGLVTLDPLKVDIYRTPPCLQGGTTGTDPYNAYWLESSVPTNASDNCAYQIATTKSSFAAGARFGYSAAGYQFAGYVATLIEATSTHTLPAWNAWQTFFAKRLSAPLSLTTYSYDVDLYYINDSSHNFGQSPPYAVNNPRISGGAAVSANDYNRILAMLLNNGVDSATGNRILNSTSAQALLTMQVNFSSTPVYFSAVPQSQVQGYSMGLFIPNGSFFTTMANTPPAGATPVATSTAQWNCPRNAGTVFFDPGQYGAVGLINSDIANPYTATNLIFNFGSTGLGDAKSIGLDMIREANTAILSQYGSPGAASCF